MKFQTERKKTKFEGTVLVNSTAAIVKATTAVISSGLLNVTASRQTHIDKGAKKAWFVVCVCEGGKGTIYGEEGGVHT